MVELENIIFNSIKQATMMVPDYGQAQLREEEEDIQSCSPVSQAQSVWWATITEPCLVPFLCQVWKLPQELQHVPK